MEESQKSLDEYDVLTMLMFHMLQYVLKDVFFHILTVFF